MNDNYTPTEQLIRFMDGELETTEITTLEADLKANPSLQQELEQLQSARMAVSRLGLQLQVASVHADMMKELKSASSQNNASTSIVRTITRYTMRVAAALLLLVIGTGAYQYFTVNPDKLFNEKYADYTIGTSRGNSSNTEIEKLFNQKNYKAVISLFESNQNPSIADNFLSGVAYLSTGNVTKAAVNFNTILTRNASFNTSEYQDDAEYYLALSYLKLNEVEKAIPLFEKIHADKLHLYHDKVSSWYLQQLKIVAWKK